ncbi:DUF6519 domain-containing protein [Leptothoe sp. ISB3NOV94-8A]
MKGDFSRDTFDSTKHYNMVLLQMGRLLLDSDWVEQQQIHQHRIETEARDVIGPCGAPKDDPGFGIEAVDNDFTIGAGRFYVNGILCINETDVAYSQQPDLPNPPDVSSLFAEAGTTNAIIYLDVWKHHILPIDDPQIREVALGGPSTATRLKTLWQVKVLPITEPVNQLSCDGDLSEWDDLIAPSTGMLNARTAAAEATDNPCLIPPGAGYLRLENQLYRVEIHAGGDGDTATFKWSRDNGSVVTAINGMDGQEITVADLGPDDVLGFAKGQWVEIIDDALELNGQPGELLQIDDFTNDAAGRPVIVLASAPTPLAAEFPNGINPDYHPKLRRWDGAATGGLPVSADWTSLEGGIQVLFSEGTYKTGDYWLIPARTATGQIEWPVTDTPVPTPIPQLPLGIDHQYCRLAIAQFLTNADGNGELEVLEICDHSFCPLTELDPGESCCTVVVQPGESIQAALDSLPPQGGCVCLKTGTHTIQQAIWIRRSNVVLKGESPGTRVVRNNGLNLLRIQRLRNQQVVNVVVHQIRFEAAGIDPEPSNLLDLTVAVISNGLNVQVDHCQFEVELAQDTDNTGSNLPMGPALGFAVVNSEQITLRDNVFRLMFTGIWAEAIATCNFSNNQFIGPTAQIDDFTYPVGLICILLNLLTSENVLLGDNCQITDNLIQDSFIGIVTGVHSDYCHIINNQIRRPAIRQLPIEEFDNQYLAGSDPYLYGIITYGNHCMIANNTINLDSPSWGGIRVFGTHTRVEDNTIISNLDRGLQIGNTQLPLSIFLGEVAENDDAPLPVLELNASVVKGNKITGILTGIGAANVEGIEISANQMTVSGNFSAAVPMGVALANTQRTVVQNNHISGAEFGVFLLGTPPIQGVGNRVLDNHISDGTYGIGAVSETALEISGNQIDNMTVAGIAASNLIEQAYLANNRLDHCGYRPPTSNATSIAATTAVGAGIFIISVLGDLTLQSSQIINTGISRQGEVAATAAFWGIAIGLVLSCDITQNHVFYSDTEAVAQMNLIPTHRSLLLLGWFAPTNVDVRFPQVGNAMVNDNIFQGIGLPHLVEFLRNPNEPRVGFEQVSFSQNQCFHLRSQTSQPPTDFITSRQGNATVVTWGRHLVVMGNQVKAADNPNFPSMDLSNPERITVMGNIASGSIINFGSGVTPPNPGDFNVYS